MIICGTYFFVSSRRLHTRCALVTGVQTCALPIWPASVEKLDLAAYDKAIALNVTSAALGAGQVAPHMRARGGGSIIFTASISGLVGSMMSPIYSAAKWGVVGLGKSLALAFAAEISASISSAPAWPTRR